MAISSTSPRSSCAIAPHNTFGPRYEGCNDIFDFTLLFEQSVLSIGPSALFLCCAIGRLVQLSKERRRTDSHPLRYLKVVATLCFVFQQVALLALWATGPVPVVETALPSAALTLVDAVALVLLSFLEHSRSPKSSDLLNVYLFFSVLFDATQVRTLWLLHRYVALSVIATLGVGIKVMLLLFEMQGKGSLLSEQYQSLAPETLSGIFNRRLFWWLNPLFRKGLRSTLIQDELYDMEDVLSSKTLEARLGDKWNGSSQQSEHSLLWATIRAFQGPFLMTIAPRFCLIGFKFAQPFLIKQIITVVGLPKTPENDNKGYGLIGATALVYIGLAICNGYYQHKNFRLITMVRGSLVSVIYGKMSASIVEDMNNNAPITLMSTDVSGIGSSLEGLHEVWASPIELGIGIWLLEREIGVACIICAVSAVACGFATMQISKATWPRMMKRNKATEERISATSTILRSMKSVKLAGLTSALSTEIQSLRSREIDLSSSLRQIMVLVNIVASFPQLVSPVITFAVFYAMDQGEKSVSRVFTALTLVMLVSGSLASFIGSTPQATSCIGCFTRIQEFLTATEYRDARENIRISLGHSKNLVPHVKSMHLDKNKDSEGHNPEYAYPAKMKGENAFEIVEASFGKKENDNNILTDINVTIPRGSFTVLTGPVACGKSTFLKVLAGETLCTAGIIRSSSKTCGYCSQTLWVQNLTIRDNVVGESFFDQVWYSKVLSACLLQDDIDSITNGDQALIGTGGITLSGGQRQRIALARAVYSRNDILLLDETLGQLDVHTSDQISSRLFGPQGLLGSSTVVLATHSTKHLRTANNIIVLTPDGRVSQQGPFSDLNNQEGFVNSLLFREVDDPEPIVEEQTMIPTSVLPKKQADTEKENLSRRAGDFGVYKHWIQSVGWTVFSFYVVLTAIYVFSCTFPQVWLRWLVEGEISGDQKRIVLDFCVYGLLALIGIVSIGLCIWYMWIYMAPKSSQNLHWSLLDVVMKAPLSFSSTIDSGVTLNRFSSDMQHVDGHVPAAVFRLVVAILNCIAAAIIISIGAAYIALAIPFVGACLYVLQKYYLRTSRQIRLLDLEATSPLYTHFTESLDGLTTIRAFGWQEAFRNRAAERLDASQKPYYLLFCIQRWLNVVMGLLVAAVAILLVSFALKLNVSSSGAISVSFVTLLGVNEQMTLLILSWTQLETSLGAIARLKAFARDTPQELQGPPIEGAERKSLRGTVCIKDISASYGPEHGPCLQNISLVFPQGSKVGIYGRTGSGKSSLILTLFRLLDPTSGTITINETDIATVSLDVLRSSIIAVPQDALALKGTVRFNLDPANHSTDAAMRAALQKTSLWDTVAASGSGLDSSFDALGLSHGQRQLFALASALLRASSGSGSIVVLDEAITSVDGATAARMQELIATEFEACTVLAVTHRVELLDSFDAVVVMEQGKVVGFGTPGELRGGRVPAVRKLFG